MNRKIFVIGLLAVAGYWPASPLAAQRAHKPLRQGDRFYDKKEYEAAEKAYREALAREPANPAALYNTGNAAYRQGHYDDAAALFADAGSKTSDPAARAAALHNLGNVYMQKNEWQKAVEAYEQSLRLRPGQPGTKSNLQLAKKKLRAQQEQEKQKQQQQNPQEQPKDQPENQDSQEKPQPNNDPAEKPQESPQSAEQQQNRQPRQSPQQPGQLTPEQARRQLETAVGPADQMSARRYRESRQQTPSKGKKDW